ncbi:MAG: hypothetical protein MN733_43620, partial [Nitrososphaera sp.]|nr:hypothetical protein [Nitrososphaera sp.]
VTAAKIKDGEVKAAEIATDAVGAAEIIGVKKLLFGQCAADSNEGTTEVAIGGTLVVECSINGVDGDDSAIATLNDNLACFDIKSAKPLDDKVSAFVHNECSFPTIFGTGSRIGIIVFDK